MIYHIERNGSPLGAIEDERIPDGLFDGTLELTDLAWCEGMVNWEPLSEIVDVEVLPEVKPSPPRHPAAVPVIMSRPAYQNSVITDPASDLAITSLVLGLVSVCAGYITGLPAIVLGIIALKKIKQSSGRYSGQGLAIGGIVCGVLLGLIGSAFLAGLAAPVFAHVQQRARLMQATSNARLIVIALKSYAADNNGLYPDADPRVNPTTANQAFRELFKHSYLEDERCFATPAGDGHPDGHIGEVPDFADALARGENGWAMSKGMSDSAPSKAPLVFEAPMIPVWPPRWEMRSIKDPNAESIARMVMIGFNDGSVVNEELQRPRAFEPMPVKPQADGSSPFDLVPSKAMLLPER